MYQVEVIFPIAVANSYSYLSQENIKPGCRVLTSLINKEKVGLVTQCRMIQEPNKRLKKITCLIDREPQLSAQLMQLIQWMVKHYHYWPGMVWQTCVPKSFYSWPEKLDSLSSKLPEKEPQISPKNTKELNEEQQQAIEKILSIQNQFYCWLLNGVTGSGKTEVYLSVSQQVINAGKQVLVLLPEIGLTRQNLQRFRDRFSNVFVYHSGCKPHERIQAWLSAKNQNCSVLIGTRSAVFTPLNQLGLIIVDEEHDDSYRQFDGVHYSARDIAVMRAKIEQVPIILGSATPSLESLSNAQKKRYHIVHLKKRAGEAQPPKMTLINMQNQKSFFSHSLISKIDERLNQREQSLLFLNRRGYSPVLLCRSCGWLPRCIHCDRPPTYHLSKKILHCHTCDWQNDVPAQCPLCQSDDIGTLGEGTEQIELALKKQFPKASIARLDLDSTKQKGKLHTILKQAHAGEIDILVGTQMISKGHDLPNITLVGIINADQGLLSSHFRSEEKFMQLITQVSGRAGRGHKPGEVLLQTYSTNHPTIQNLLSFDYLYCAQQILKSREMANLPPYHYQALFRVECPKEHVAKDFITQSRKIFQSHQQTVKIYPIVPATLERIGIYYRWQCLLQSDTRKALHYLLEKSFTEIRTWRRPNKLRWALQLDPTDL